MLDICSKCENRDFNKFGFYCMCLYTEVDYHEKKCYSFKLSGCHSRSDGDPMLTSPLPAKPVLDK